MAESARVHLLLAVLVAFAVVAPSTGLICKVKGSNVINIYLTGVDFGFLCWPDSDPIANLWIKTWSAGTTMCNANNITSPYLGCRALSPGSRYYGEVKGYIGYSRTDFYTPGDCRVSNQSMDCQSKTVTAACTAGSRVNVEVLDMNSVSKYLYLNVTTPFLVPDGIVDGDMMIMTALDPNGNYKVFRKDCSLPTPSPTPGPPTDSPSPTDVMGPTKPPRLNTPVGQSGFATPTSTPPIRTATPLAAPPPPPPPGAGATPSPTPKDRGYNLVETPTPAPGGGSSLGDPHVTTFDGITVTYLSTGDNIMLMTDDGLKYQARHCSQSGEGSSTCAVALQCSADGPVAEVYADTPNLRAFLGGKEQDVKAKSVSLNAGDISIKKSPKSVILSCPKTDFKLTLIVHDSSEFMYLDTIVGMPELYMGRTTGLMGVWDGDNSNDIVFSNGEVWNPGHGLTDVTAVDYPDLSDVQASWFVPKGESLFTIKPKESSGGNRRRLLSVRDAFDDVERKLEATAFCNKLGLSGVFLKMCMFDFVATGDEVFVSNILESRRILGLA